MNNDFVDQAPDLDDGFHLAVHKMTAGGRRILQHEVVADLGERHDVQATTLGLADKLPPVTGHLEIFVNRVHADGRCELTKHLDFGNVVVNNFRSQELTVLGGIGLANRVITSIEFGVNSAAENVTDVAITAPGIGPVIVALSSYTFPAYNQVQFVGTLGTAVANGVAFVEAGLLFFNTAPALATRKVFATMTKSADFEWTIHWTLTV